MFVQRLGKEFQLNDEYIDELIKTFNRQKGCCTEVWFTTLYGYPQKETHKKTANKLVEQAKKFRDNGYEVSMQVANTLGHGDYMLSCDCSGLVYEGTPTQRVVGAHGETCNACFCYNDETFKSYIIETLNYYAPVKPRILWFDDDFRLFYHDQVKMICFCDKCIAKFNKKHNTSYTREEIANGVKYDTPIREQYVEFIKEGFGSFVYDVTKAFAEVSPDTEFGVQYGDFKTQMLFGYDFIFEAIHKASGGKTVHTRPGGAAYNDHNPNELLNKAIRVNYNNSKLPDYVHYKAPEQENLPDTVFGKSGEGTCFETSYYLANGANGATYAMIMRNYEPMSYHESIFRKFKEHRPYWDKLIELNEGTYQDGLSYKFFDTALHSSLKDIDNWEDDFHKDLDQHALGILRTGIPLAYDKKSPYKKVYILDNINAQNLTEEEIDYLSTQPVICDADAFAIVNAKKKLSDVKVRILTAVECHKTTSRFSGHTVNKGFKNKTYPAAFAGTNKCAIKGRGMEVLARYYATEGENTVFAGNASGVVTLNTSAKWIVDGCGLWHAEKSFDRRNQILAMANYLLKDSIKVKVLSKMQAILLPRANANGELTSFTVVNPTIGVSPKVRVEVCAPANKTFMYINQSGKTKQLKPVKKGEKFVLEMPPLDAYKMATVYLV